MVKINNKLFNYPVTITDEDFEKSTGINLQKELAVEKVVELEDWLVSAHECVYNRIYSVGGQTLKNRVINAFKEVLEKTIKRCLIVQLQYMLDSNGDYGKVDGSYTDANGNLNLIDNDVLKKKILAPKVEEILKSVRPNLLIGE